MKCIAACLVFVIVPAWGASSDAALEHLGTVAFANSCSPAVQVPLNRAVALLHDFWYEEAQAQFERVSQADSNCAIAHWGAAISQFHQIWDRPNPKVFARGWAEMQKAQSPAAGTARERSYVEALSGFYKPAKEEYQKRIETYSAAMGKLSNQYPDDVDAGAFYALSLLAAAPPDDTSLASQRSALAVLMPLFAKNPDHPGVVHYIIHACDTPSLAPQGLAAAVRYGEIAPSAPHSAHMPGHIFARLGLWQQDIDANLASVAASQRADARHLSGALDQLHSYDFLLYAYLQSGQDAHAKEVLSTLTGLLEHFQTMPDMVGHRMQGMLPYYRTKLPVFYSLEMRDWKSAMVLQPVERALPEARTLTYWARIIAAGHLRNADAARASLATYDKLIDQLKKGDHAYMEDSTGAKIEASEVRAWTAFAEGNLDKALKGMREAAALQDQVGQGEVDIPAREMLADMLLESHQEQQALVEYDVALKMSPNRLNGLFNAGLAAEATGDKPRAEGYYAALMKLTGDGNQSARPEFTHMKNFVGTLRAALAKAETADPQP